MRNKRLKSHSHEWWHPRSTLTSGAGSGASHGTHQYHYLGSTVAVVAGKLDPTVGQLCFLSNLSNGEEYANRDHGNDFRGSKNGGKELWGARKWPEMAGKSRIYR